MSHNSGGQYSKGEYYASGNVVTAQPVVMSSNNVGYSPTIVQVNSTPAPGPVVAIQSQQSSLPPQLNRIPRPLPGFWADSICDWPRNLWPSCWCTCCCCNAMYIVSQMSEKTQFYSFRAYFGFFCMIWILAIILQITLGGSFVIWLPAVVASLMAIALRIHIVRKYQIRSCGNPGFCNELGEACTGLWCWYCSVTQMARFVYGYTKLLDGDSDIYRDDNYERV